MHLINAEDFAADHYLSNNEQVTLYISVKTDLFVLSTVFQSKEIGIQMHDELVKVTNELYTVSIPHRRLINVFVIKHPDIVLVISLIHLKKKINKEFQALV